jgi:hypothetical protein
VNAPLSTDHDERVEALAAAHRDAISGGDRARARALFDAYAICAGLASAELSCEVLERIEASAGAP